MKTLQLWRLKALRKWHQFIRTHYQKIRRGTNFVKEAYHVEVKKGKVRYYLLVIETYDGRNLRFNLGRHLTKDCKVQELPIKK